MRILLLLSQMPQDPASGAARSMKTIAQMLAHAGNTVCALATTATEQAVATDPLVLLSGEGPLDLPASANSPGGVLRFARKEITYTLLHVGDCSCRNWNATFGPQFDDLYTRALASFRPDVVFTYGGSAAECRRRRMARDIGSAVVMSLHNLDYLDARAFEYIDAVFTPSEFMTRRYREAVGIQTTTLPLPMDPEEIVAPQREAVFFTYINPSPEKGVMFFARFARELSLGRPDIPLLVVEARGAAGNLVQAGQRGGFDLRHHDNLMISPGSARPRDIYAATRVLLVPSVWQEPAGRAPVEAMMNGIPPITSDRGGLPEVCRGGGFVLPLPRDLTPESPAPVRACDVLPWIDLAIRLADDEAFYSQASAKAVAAAQAFRADQVVPQYQDFFRRAAEMRRSSE